MRIGIIGPSEEEIITFIGKITHTKTESYALLTFHCGTYQDVEVIALYCGVCKVNAAIATQILKDIFRVSHIILTGVAGGIDSNLKIGDTVISTEIAHHDVADDILTDYHPWLNSIYFKADSQLVEFCQQMVNNNHFNQHLFFGRIVTGEAFITDEGREKIINNHHPLCVDMETASVAHVCYANNIPFIAIRSITDTENESGQEVFEVNCEKAALNSLAIVEKLLDKLKELV